MRHRPNAVFHIKARNTKSSHSCSNLVGNLLRRADIQRTSLNFEIKLSPSDRWPAAFSANPIPQLLIVGPDLLTCLGIGIGYVAR